MTSITHSRAKAIAAVFGATLAWTAQAGALELPLPNGSRGTFVSVSPADSYALPISGWTKDGGLPVATLSGEVLRKAWRIASAAVTTGQVLDPLRDALIQANYDIIFECSARSCGGFDFRFATDVVPAPDMYVDLSDYRFLSAKAPDNASALSLLVSRDGGSVYVQLIEVGPEGRSGVTVEAAAGRTMAFAVGDLTAELERVGHVALDDLVFQSGSAALGDGPLASLDEIATYLLANPSRKITFVGHTDATGSLEANVALSRRRAEAARAYVIAQGVPADQVASDGVGYLSPRTTNLTAEGRDANRRVEAVLVSTQ